MTYFSSRPSLFLRRYGGSLRIHVPVRLRRVSLKTMCRQWLRLFWAAPFILPSESRPQNRLNPTIFNDSDFLKIGVISLNKSEIRISNTTQNSPPKPKERGKILSYPKA